MRIRKYVAVVTSVMALGGGLALLPANPAAAAYTCHIDASGGYTYAGYYSGLTVQPSTTGVSSAGIEAQCLLKAAGYNPGTIDGVFGTNSQNATKAFQRTMVSYGHSIRVDGKVGSQTWPWLRVYAF